MCQEQKFQAIKALQNDYYFSSDSEGEDEIGLNSAQISERHTPEIFTALKRKSTKVLPE